MTQPRHLSKQDKKLFRPFDDLFLDFTRRVQELVDAMPDEQFKALKAAADRPSTINCGWYTYRVAPHVREAIWERELKTKEPRADEGVPGDSLA